MMSLVDLGKKLIESAKRGSTEEIRALMANGAPFSTDWLGNSPLHHGASSGNTTTVQVLLRAGICRDARTKVDRTPLHVAAQEGHLEIVVLLLKNSADVNAKDMLKMSPLHWAVDKGHTEIVQHLLNNGADALASDKFDRTPMDIAMRHMHMDIAELLQTAEATKDTIKPDQIPVREEEVTYTMEEAQPTAGLVQVTSAALTHSTTIVTAAGDGTATIMGQQLGADAHVVGDGLGGATAMQVGADGATITGLIDPSSLVVTSAGGAQEAVWDGVGTVAVMGEDGIVRNMTAATAAEVGKEAVVMTAGAGGEEGSGNSVLATLAALAEVTPPMCQQVAAEGINADESAATETLQWLESQGITAVITRADGSVAALAPGGHSPSGSARNGPLIDGESGQTLTLTEAGRLALSSAIREQEAEGKVVVITSESNGELGIGHGLHQDGASETLHLDTSEPAQKMPRLA